MADGRTIQLVSCDSTGELKLHENACDYLSTLTAPLGVLAVVGPQRSGKSTLLNELLGAGAAFQTSNRVASCTKGLWAKAVPAPTWCPWLEGGWLLLLDTEGLGSPDAPLRDPQLFALAAILSSVVAYNSFGLLEELSVVRLARLSSVASQVLNGAGAASEHSDGSFTSHRASSGKQPALLWVLRDFSHELTDELSGEAISASSYLEMALGTCREDFLSKRSSAGADARELLTSTFRRRHCSTLPQPFADEPLQTAVLDNLDHAAMQTPCSLAWHAAVSALRDTLGAMLQPKSIECAALDGHSLSALLARAVELLASPDAVRPEASDQLSCGILDAQAERARHLALSTYSQRLAERIPEHALPVGRRAIEEAHRSAKAAAVQVYADTAPFSSSSGTARLRLNDAPQSGCREASTTAALIARSDPHWMPARTKLRGMRADATARDEAAARVRCEGILGHAGTAMAKAIDKPFPSSDLTSSPRVMQGRLQPIEPSRAHTEAIEELEHIMRPHLQRFASVVTPGNLPAPLPLHRSSSPRSAAPSCASASRSYRQNGSVDYGESGSGVDAWVVDAASDWDVPWSVVSASLPLLLRRTSHAAARLGANIALRLALERHAAVLSEAQAESETLNQAVSAAQSESFEMRAACDATSAQAQAAKLREGLLSLELSALESLHFDATHVAGTCADGTVGVGERDSSGNVEGRHRVATERLTVLGARSASMLPPGRGVLACGLNFSLACCEDGSLFTWGTGSKGQLGIAHALKRPAVLQQGMSSGGVADTETGEPRLADAIFESTTAREVVVAGLTAPPVCTQNSPSLRSPSTTTHSSGVSTWGVALVSASAEHALAVDMGGGVWSWGSGKNGELGTGHLGISGTPRLIKGLAKYRVVSIAAGGRHCAAVSSAGELFTWGDGRMGQLGHGDTQSRLMPTPVVALHSRHIDTVACGLEHTVAVGAAGGAYAFGAARHGRLGNSPGATGETSGRHSGGQVKASRQPLPCAVNTAGCVPRGGQDIAIMRLVGAACGDAHTLLWTGGGKLLACGHGGKGALGLGGPADALRLRLVPGLDGVWVRQAVAGSDFSLCLGSHGECFGFGANGLGQLGLGHLNAPVLLPRRIEGLDKRSVVAISAGSSHALALCSDGQLLAWGNSSSRQLGLGDGQLATGGARSGGSTLLTSAVAASTPYTRLLRSGGNGPPPQPSSVSSPHLVSGLCVPSSPQQHRHGLTNDGREVLLGETLLSRGTEKGDKKWCPSASLNDYIMY